MNNYKIYIGLNDKDQKKQLIATENAMKIIANETISQMWFGTIYTGTGIYTHENWELVQETTIIIETSTDEEILKKFVQKIWKTLNQESIFYKIENDWNFISITY